MIVIAMKMVHHACTLGVVKSDLTLPFELPTLQLRLETNAVKHVGSVGNLTQPIPLTATPRYMFAQ